PLLGERGLSFVERDRPGHNRSGRRRHARLGPGGGHFRCTRFRRLRRLVTARRDDCARDEGEEQLPHTDLLGWGERPPLKQEGGQSGVVGYQSSGQRVEVERLEPSCSPGHEIRAVHVGERTRVATPRQSSPPVPLSLRERGYDGRVVFPLSRKGEGIKGVRTSAPTSPG